MTKPKSAIQKGKLLEDHIANQIREKGLDPKAYRSHGSGSGNAEKGDIWTSVSVFGRNLGIEAKNHKTLHIPEWLKQVEKLETLGREPVLAFKIHNEPLEATRVVIYLDTFLDLIKSQSDRGEIIIDDSKQRRDVEYQVRFIKDACNKILKANKYEDT